MRWQCRKCSRGIRDSAAAGGLSGTAPEQAAVSVATAAEAIPSVAATLACVCHELEAFVQGAVL